AFLDQLAKQVGQDPQSEMILFLAQSFSSLDNHKQAAELLERVPEPKPSGDEKTPDARKVQVYRAARILAARELRLDRQFDKAKVLLETLLGTAKQPGWAHDNLDAQKERIYLLEDQEQFGQAMLAWN